MTGCPFTIHSSTNAPVIKYMGCCYEFVRSESSDFCPPLPSFPDCYTCWTDEEVQASPAPSPGAEQPGPSPDETVTCREDLCYCSKDYQEYGVCDEMESGRRNGFVVVSLFLNNNDNELKNNLILFAGAFNFNPDEYPVGCKINVSPTREQVYWVKENSFVSFDSLPLGERFLWKSDSAVKNRNFPFERPDNGVFKIGQNGTVTLYPAIPHPCGLGDMEAYTTIDSLDEKNRDHAGMFDDWNPASLFSNYIGPADMVALLEGGAIDLVEEEIEKYISDVSFRRHQANITGTIDYNAAFPDDEPPRIIHDSKTGLPSHVDPTCTPKIVSRSTHTFNYFDKIIFANKPVRLKAVAEGFDIGYVPVQVYNISFDPIELDLKEITEASWEVGSEPLGLFEDIVTFDDALKKQADYQEDDSTRSVSKFLFHDFKQSFNSDAVKENMLKQARCNTESNNNATANTDVQSRLGDPVSEFIGANVFASSVVNLSEGTEGDIVYLTGIFVEKNHFRQIIQTHTCVGNDRPRYFFPGQTTNEIAWKSSSIEQRVYSNAEIRWPRLDVLDDNNNGGVELPLEEDDFDESFWFERNYYSYGKLLTTNDNKTKFEEKNDGVFNSLEETAEEETLRATDAYQYNRTVNIESKNLVETFNFVLKPHIINGIKTNAWRISEVVSDPWMLYKKMFRSYPDDVNAPFSSSDGEESVDLCYGMDEDGIKKIIMKSDGSFDAEIMIPSDSIRDQNWYNEYMEVYNDDVAIIDSSSKKIEDLLLIKVTPKTGLYDNDSDPVEIDRIRWTYAMLSGLLFDVSDIVNENLTDHQKLPYMRDFAYAINDANVPFREFRQFVKRGDLQSDGSTLSESGPLESPRSVSKYDPEENVENPCLNTGIGYLNLDIINNELEDEVELVNKENEIITSINDLSYAIFEPKQIISCKVDRAILTGGEDFVPPSDGECPKDDGTLITRPEPIYPDIPSDDFELTESCPVGVPVNFECCIPRVVQALPRTYDPFDIDGSEAILSTDTDFTFNSSVDQLAYMRRVGVKKFSECNDNPCFEDQELEFLNVFGGSPATNEDGPQVSHFLNADISAIKQEVSIHGLYGDFGEGFSAYVETFSIDRQHPEVLDIIADDCDGEPIFGGYKNRNSASSYMANFDCLGIYPELPIEYFNVESNKILEGNVSIASNPYLRSGIVTTPTYFHNNISFNFVGTDAEMDWENTPTGILSKKLDGET